MDTTVITPPSLGKRKRVGGDDDAPLFTFSPVSFPPSPPPLPPPPLPEEDEEESEEEEKEPEVNPEESASRRLRLCGNLQLSSERAQWLLAACCDSLAFNGRDHVAFAQAFAEGWLRVFGFPLEEAPSKGNLHLSNTYRYKRRGRKGKWLGTVEAVEAETRESLQRHRCAREHLEEILCEVLATPEDWRASVSRLEQVPSSVHRALLLCRLPLPSCFPNLSLSSSSSHLPWYAECTVSSMRVRKYLAERQEQEQERARGEQPPPLKRSKKKEKEEDTASSTDSLNMGRAFEGESATSLRLLPEEERVAVRCAADDPGAFKYGRLVTVHPYAISEVAFTLAVYVHRCLHEERGREVAAAWDPSRIYFFLRDWLQHGERARRTPASTVPPELPHVASALLEYLTYLAAPQFFRGVSASPSPWSLGGRLLWQDMSALLGLFAPAHTLLRAHRSKDRGLGSFHRFHRLRRFSELRRELDAQASPGLEQYELTADEASASPYEILRFERADVGPLDLRRSLEVVERWLHSYRADGSDSDDDFLLSSLPSLDEHQRYVMLLRAQDGGSLACHPRWRIFLTRTHTYLVICRRRLALVAHHFNAQVAPNAQRFARDFHFPLHLHHFHGYFRGGRLGLLLSVKFLIKCFSHTRHSSSSSSSSSLYPSAEDSVVDHYRVLHRILARFGSEEDLWGDLTAPLRQRVGNLRLTKGKRTKRQTGDEEEEGPLRGAKTRGLLDAGDTIYHGLRAFAQVYARHSLRLDVLDRLHELFVSWEPGQRLQREAGLVWCLVEALERRYYRQRKDVRWEDSGLPRSISAGKDACVEVPHDLLQRACRCEGRVHARWPWPAHLVLYHFAASPDLCADDALAQDIFIGLDLLGSHRGYVAPFTFSGPSALGAKALATQRLRERRQQQQRLDEPRSKRRREPLPPLAPSPSPSPLPCVLDETRERIAPILADANLELRVWAQRHVRLFRDEALHEELASADNLAFLLRSLEELSAYPSKVPVVRLDREDPSYRGNAVPGLFGQRVDACAAVRAAAAASSSQAKEEEEGGDAASFDGGSRSRLPRYPLELDWSGCGRLPEMLYTEDLFPVWPSGFSELTVGSARGDPATQPLLDCSCYTSPALTPAQLRREECSVHQGSLESRPLHGCHRDLAECVLLYPIRLVEVLPSAPQGVSDELELSWMVTAHAGDVPPRLPADDRFFYHMGLEEPPRFLQGPLATSASTACVSPPSLLSSPPQGSPPQQQDRLGERLKRLRTVVYVMGKRQDQFKLPDGRPAVPSYYTLISDALQHNNLVRPEEAKQY